MEKKNPHLHLIDVSSEDDCLISSSSSPATNTCTTTAGFLGNPNDHEYFELSVVETAQERVDAVNQIVERKDIMLAESSEPDRTRKTAKCNLRKSLAWDSAFFTSAGVLEPEELSILNSGLKKANLHPLLGIEEDIRRSAESTSTLDSDNLTLESLEVGLFDDIRASIQKSNKVSHRTSSDQTGSGECDVQKLHSSRKMEFASRNKMKPTAAIKNQIVTVQGLEKNKKKPENLKKEAEKTKEARGTSKEAFARPRAVQAAARSGKLNTSSLRPPKIAGRVNLNPLSPTNTSLGANRLKIDNSPLMTGRRDTIVGSKRPVFADPSANSQSVPSLKLSSTTSVSATKMESAASCSPHSVSSSSSNSTDKSPLNPLRKKTYSRNLNLSSSSLKSPRGNSSKNKSQLGNPRLEAYLTSISKLNSSISPATSLDRLSSGSSSSTSVDQRCSSGNNLDISSPRKGFHLEKGVSGKDMQKHYHDRVEQKRTGLPSPRSKKSIPGAGTLIRPATTDGCRSSKPSGLRMPSPKIGFFDAEKSTEIPPAGRMQFHPGVRTAIPKHGAPVGSVHGGTIRAKPGKLQPSKTMAGRSSVNSDPHVAVMTQCASSTESARSLHPQGSSNASPKKSTGKTTGASCSSLKSTTQNDDRTHGGSHSITGVVREMNTTNGKSTDFFLNEGENGGHADSANDKDAARRHISAVKTGREDCFDIAPKLQGDTYDRDGIESHLDIGVVSELTNTEHFSSFPGEEGNAEELSCASTKISTTASGGNRSSITLTSRDDDRIIRESHTSTVEVEEMITTNSTTLGSFPNNRENVGEDDFVNGMDTTCEEVSALKARTEDCPSIASKQQSIKIGIENHLKTGEVGELSGSKCSSPFPTREIGGQGSSKNDAGITREIVSPTKATRVSQDIPLEQNDLYHRSGSERCLKREVRELMKTEGGSKFLKEGQAICQDALKNGVGNLCEKLLNLDSITRISTKGMPEISCKPNSSNKTASSEVGKKLVHDPSHLQSNLCHDNNEKENSLCYGNQVDLLGRQVGIIDPTVEELIGKKGSSLSRRDGKGGSTEDTILLPANSREVLVDGHGDYPKLLLKEDVQTDSS